LREENDEEKSKLFCNVGSEKKKELKRLRVRKKVKER
jgi:hypothetical protein